MSHCLAISRAATVADINAFDEVVDARSPGEFAEDHIPGAVNLPVLDDEERARVGTLYKQVSPFKAKITGAALVSRNIARQLEMHFADKPKQYRPLVYCWRGGSRSGALVHVLQKIGFAAQQLEGGYKAYRRNVVTELETLPARYQFRVVSGPTGSGKSRLLQALDEAGAQALDLEEMAAHRGSVLGNLPGQLQPTQKFFESRLHHTLLGFKPEQPVYVESESKKIGNLRVPETLIATMRASECIRLEVPREQRISLLIAEYAHFLASPELLSRQLDCLRPLQGAENVNRWQALAHSADWTDLVDELLERHYDPAYQKSITRNYPSSSNDLKLDLDDVSLDAYRQLAQKLMATV